MKTAKQLGITPTQRRNIARLTLFVKDAVPPPKFNIKSFHSKEEEGPSGVSYECGTTACFCGYGPLAGIKPKKGEGWSAYSTRTMAYRFGEVWTFLFDTEHKNSKAAAVRRGAWLLMNGLPDDVNICTWEPPKSFKPDWEAIKSILA